MALAELVTIHHQMAIRGICQPLPADYEVEHELRLRAARERREVAIRRAIRRSRRRRES